LISLLSDVATRKPATSVTHHAIFGLLVGGDAESDREYSSDEDEGVVNSGLLRDESASAEARKNR